jgi:hypothetical protein
MIHEIIDRVRTSRNNKIKEFSEKRVVLEHFNQQHGIELSDRKYEFLLRDLNELLIAPVDLVHYSAVITEFKESPGKPGLNDHCDRLTMAELNKIFKKYTF